MIRKSMAPNVVECVIVYNAATGVLDDLRVEAEGVDAVLLCMAFTPAMWYYHGLPRFAWGLVVDWFALMDVETCLYNNKSSDVTYNAGS